MSTTLGELLAAAGIHSDAAPTTQISSVAYDSRRVAPGALFVAVPGLQVDGAAFIHDAIAHGASAIVGHRSITDIPHQIPFITVADSRRALSQLAAAWYQHPSRALTVAGITGTDGKTTTTTLLHAAWRGADISAASFSTVDFRLNDAIAVNTTHQTTAESLEVQEQLVDARAQGCTNVALEVSSHALAMGRVADVDFRAAVYTSITSDHLDFHETHDAYIAAKMQLLHMVAQRHDGIAILNYDDAEHYRKLAAISCAQQLTYSASGNPHAHCIATDITEHAEGIHFVARTPWGTTPVALRLLGKYNAGNALAALATACATGADFAGAVSGIAQLSHVTGRLERIDAGQKFNVFVDFAHTPGALETVLSDLRPLTLGRLWIVFGAPGERDASKRPAMGETAARWCDIVILTNDDPRSEDAMSIIEEIAGGIEGDVPSEVVRIIPDREMAVAFAINHAAENDTVLLAGKGHETSITIGKQVIPWDDRGAAEKAIAQRLHGQSA